MIDYRLEPCCEDCPVIIVETETKLAVSEEHKIIGNTAIYCTHETACKLLAEEKKRKIIRNCNEKAEEEIPRPLYF